MRGKAAAGGQVVRGRTLEGAWWCIRCGCAGGDTAAPGPGVAEPGLDWCGLWGGGLTGSSSYQAGERHAQEEFSEHGKIEAGRERDCFLLK